MTTTTKRGGGGEVVVGCTCESRYDCTWGDCSACRVQAAEWSREALSTCAPRAPITVVHPNMLANE